MDEVRKARLARFGAGAQGLQEHAPPPHQHGDQGEESSPSDTGWQKELECPICLRLLHQPIATSCGHTFCSVCLAQSLRRKGACPVCRVPLGNGVASAVPNRVIAAIIHARFPAERAERDAEAEEERQRAAATPMRLPLFFLPDLLPFPGTPVDLRVYEPRYLLMLQRLLDNDGGDASGPARSFGMVRCAEPGEAGAVGVLLSIERVQRPPLGVRMHAPCLLVSTRAGQRFRILDAPAPEEEGGTHGLVYASVKPFADEEVGDNEVEGGGEPAFAEELSSARARVAAAVAALSGPQASELYARFGSLAPHLAKAEALSMWLAAAVPSPSVAARVAMLETTSTAARLRAALGYGEMRARQAAEKKAALRRRGQGRGAAAAGGMEAEGEVDTDGADADAALPLSFDLYSARGSLLPFQGVGGSLMLFGVILLAMIVKAVFYP